MPYTGYTDLASRDEVYDAGARVRRAASTPTSPPSPRSPDSQIHRFLILHKELEADDGELTRTRKVRRGFIGEKYKSLLEALYSVSDNGSRRARRCATRTAAPARYSADLKIRDAKTFRTRSGETGRMILSVEGVSLAFGGVRALQEVSFDVTEHEIRAIIGPNGAGKSSMLNVLNGVYHPQKGKIRFKEKVFADMDSHQAAELGIARTFQNIALFKGMTRARQHHDRPQPEDALQLPAAGAVGRRGAARGARAPARRGGDHRLPRDPAHPQDPGGAPRLRPAEARRARPRARRRADAPSARRADGGHEPRGEAATCAASSSTSTSTTAPPSC